MGDAKGCDLNDSTSLKLDRVYETQINLADRFVTNAMTFSADWFWNHMKESMFKWNEWIIGNEWSEISYVRLDEMIDFYSLIFAMTNPSAYIHTYIQWLITARACVRVCVHSINGNQLGLA